VHILGLYEVAIRVRDLATSETFYREILGLEVGVRDDRRKWLFLRAGGQAGMVVLQEDKGTWPTQHFAFTIEEADIEAAAEALQKRLSRVDAGKIRLLFRSRRPRIGALRSRGQGMTRGGGGRPFSGHILYRWRLVEARL